MQKETNRWKGFLLGIVGGIVGVLAMDYYWKKAAPVIEKQLNGQQDRPDNSEFAKAYEDVSIYGKQYRQDESSTAALGRITYTRIKGEEPGTEETRTFLSYLVHWIYGMLQGGIYGTLRGRANMLDFQGGLTFGTVLWFFGDEVMVPLLGLQGGPSSVSKIQHLNRLGAHWAYGTATAITTQALQRII